MVEGLVSWLNNNSGLVIAIASVITALATGVIAGFSIVSARALRWDKEKERRNRMPVLVFVNEENERAKGLAEQNLFVKNIGYGPAIDVVFDIPQTGEEMQPRDHGTAPYKGPVRLGSLGSGDKIQTYISSQSKVPITENQRLIAVLEYMDILGNCYEIRYEQRQHSKPVQSAKRIIPFERVQRI